MKPLKLIIIVISFIYFINAFAKVDPHNTYQWNRKNVLKGKSVVKNKPWFEWWYYKVVLPQENESFYFVYGVVNPWDKNKKLKGTRSYVGMGNFTEKTISEELFGVDEFEASYVKTDIKIGRNHATDKQFSGDIIGKDGERTSWDISIEKKWGYNAVGWMTGKNITNIEWYSAQADARCNGIIEGQGKTYQFEDAPCYQDRNWGSIFPKWWAWIVSNEFENHPDTALSVGGGAPTVLKGKYIPMEGLSIGLKHKGEEYSFRPNYLDRIEVEVSFGKWEAVGINGVHKIEISAYAPMDKFMDLEFMTPEGEIFHDYETLSGEVTVKLYKKSLFGLGKWKLIDILYSKHTGIEYGSRDIRPLDTLFFTGNNLIYRSN